MLRRFLKSGLVLAVAAGVGLSGVVLAGSPEPASFPGPDYLVGVDRMSTAEAIGFFETRHAGGHHDPLTLATLGRLHLTRAREIGDQTELEAAEDALREALVLHPNDTDALVALSVTVAALHRFDEAAELAEMAHSLEQRPATWSLIGDMRAAVGDYAGARTAYAEAAAYGHAAVLPGLALLAEVFGRPEEAIRLLETAAAKSLEAHAVGEPAAWYQQRLGDLHFELGQLDRAERRYQAALDLFPASHDAPAGLGRVEAARGAFGRAIHFYLQAVRASAQPDILIELGDVYLASGEREQAEQRYRDAIAALKSSTERVFARDLAMFYADHDRNPGEALRLAQDDLERRADVHGYETLAWALYRNGRYPEAREASDLARQHGTEDAGLLYRAGLISLALGDQPRAAAELTRALELNPRFHPLHAPHAVAVLAGIDL